MALTAGMMRVFFFALLLLAGPVQAAWTPADIAA